MMISLSSAEVITRIDRLHKVNLLFSTGSEDIMIISSESTLTVRM
jgi:hypothetical protein